MNIKNKISIILLAVVCSVSFLSCKKEKDEKMSDSAADFTYTVDNLGGVTVTILNYDTRYSFDYDFGDGSTVDRFSSKYDVQDGRLDIKKYYFKSNGDYSVKVTATSTDTEPFTISSTQTVSISTVPSKYKLKYFKLKDYPTLNPNNSSNWDVDASDPDIAFSYQIDYSIYSRVGNTYTNASKAILPLQLNTDTISFDISSTNTYVTVSAFDYDSPTTGDFISTLSFNPFESTAQGVNYLNGQNSDLYPALLSDTYFEVGIEWLP